MAALIVVVDDEEELRENLQDLLEFKGYSVTAYATGEDLLQNLDAIQPDLVLLDIQLPGVNGLEVLRKIRESKSKEELPIAIVSASSVRSVLAQAESYGANKTILKPYALQDMIDAVAELLGPKANTS